MKKTTLRQAAMKLAIVAIALFAPLGLRAQETVTVHDGTTTNSVIPAYIMYFDDYTRSQYVIPATELEDMSGGTINAIKFYTTNQNVPYTTVSTVDVYLMEVGYTTMTALEPKANGTIVYQGYLNVVSEGTGGSLTITFSTPYTYGGGNLLVGIENTTDVNYKSIYFYGESVNGASWGGYNSSSLTNVTGSQKNFIPKTTFTYEPAQQGGDVCEKPATCEISDVHATSATLTWSGGSGTYNVEVKGGSYEDWTAILTNTALTTTTLTLQPTTSYQARVQSVCDGSTPTSGWKTSASFSTPCGETTLPYFYGFEDASPLACWTMTDCVSSTGRYQGTANTDSYCFRFYYGYNDQFLISPELSGTGNGVYFSFYYRQYSNGTETFHVGYSTTTNSTDAFTWGDEMTATTSYQLYENVFPAGTKYVAIKLTSYDQYYLYIDDVNLTLPPTCYMPTAAQVDEYDQTTATISWVRDTRNADGETYSILMVREGDDDLLLTTSTTPAVSISGSTASLTGLTQSTPYSFKVVTNCANTEENVDFVPLSFTTLASCPAPTATLTDNSVTAHGATIQWNDMGSTGYNVRWQVSNSITVDFESGSLPDGWTANTTSSSSGVQSNQGRNNSYGFRFHYTESGATLVSPVLSGTENGVNFSFYYRRNSDSYTEGFKVGYNTDGSDEFTYGDEISVTNTSSWLQYENAFPAGTKRIAIQYVYHDAMYLHIDDIDITIPNDNWTTVNDITNANYPITGLTADTRYLAQVQSVCGSEVSDWSESVSFTTEVACPAPTALTAGAATTNSVPLSWTAGATNQDNWQICINGDEENLLDVTDATVTGTTVTYTLTGLTSGADYSVKVRANCGDEDGVSQQWTDTVNFTTEASCTEPSTLAVVENSVQAHQVQLSWTAGGEEESWDIYYSNTNSAPVNGVTEPTIEGVTENNPYTLIGLTDARTYYVWVRAHCGDAAGQQSPWVGPVSFSTPQEAVTAPYADDFENGNNWLLVNGNLNNVWAYGEAVNNGGTHALYISNDGGATNAYNNGSAAMVYATKLITFEEGTYKFSYDWKANGESTYDYLRVALGPATTTLTAGTSVPTGFSTTTLPTGWTALDGGSKLNLKTDWQSYGSAEMPIAAGTYMMVFAWKNDGIGGSNPPAAIDNVSIEKITCIAPTALAASNVTAHAATLGWTAGADEEAWQIAYGTTADFDQDDVTPIDDVTENPYLFGNLTQSTHYYVYVRAKCGEDDYSNWSNMTDFNTISGKQMPTGLTVTDIASATATATWTGVTTNVLHESYDLYYSKLSSMPETLNEDSLFTGITETSFEFTGLTPETGYHVWVRDICGDDGESDWTSTSFTTLRSCPTPTDLTATNITNNAATIRWTGSSDVDNYTVQYRTAAYMDGITEEFNGNSIPTGWTMYTGMLNDNTATLNSVTYGWSFGSNNGVFDSHARVNIYSNNQRWLVTPALTVPENGVLNFDMALTAFSGSSVPAPSTTGTDDKFIVLVTTDNMDTWNILRKWDNEGSEYVYNNIANTATGENVNIDLSEYAGASVKIAFYGESTESNADNNLHIDNVAIGTPVAEGEWNDATEDVAAESFTIEGLEAETKYDVQVKSNCTNGEYSAPYTFTTASVFTKSIQANKWYAIATPAHDCVKPNDAVALTNVLNLTTADHDLYSYDEANGSWMAESDSLMRGTGYIYRSAADAELGFVGYANTGSVSVSVTYSTTTDPALKGFNLIGNPYPHTVAVSRAFYTLKPEGTWMAKTRLDTITAAEACLVQTNYSTTYTFNDVIPNTSSKSNSNTTLALTVSNEEYSDVAYAMLENGEGLPKIGHLAANAPMLSIPVEGRRYAIANLGSDCESFDMVFRGTGTYTLSFNGNTGYCHLIDRVAGKEIDMLRQNYTFSSNGFDADRFTVKLSPDAQENAGSNFAYWNGNVWMVEGNGTLQVFDALGRQLLSQEISNSNFEIQNSLFPAAGVYVLRMGEKTQKIVVR